MGSCESLLQPAEIREQNKVSKRIEKELDKKTNFLEQKVLLLGPGESGKSTVLKQMRLMHHSGFLNHELIEKKCLIFVNILQGIKDLLDFANENGLNLKDDEFEAETEILDCIKKHGVGSIQLTKDLTASLKKIWNSEAIQIAYTNRAKFHLTESIEYFFDHIDRITEPDFVPNYADILHTRAPTSGVVQIDFVTKMIKFVVYDVGGQRSERKKWIHCFDDVNAILFITAVSEFDQCCIEDGITNRVEEAVQLFKDIVNLKFFLKTSMILFMNKIDLFEKKIGTIFISNHFPDFKKENTYENGMAFFRRKFEKTILAKNRKPYVHETCAVSDTVQIVINSVIDTVVQENLKDTGMI